MVTFDAELVDGLRVASLFDQVIGADVRAGAGHCPQIVGASTPLRWKAARAFDRRASKRLLGMTFPGNWSRVKPVRLAASAGCARVVNRDLFAGASTHLLKSPLYISGVGTVAEVAVAPLRLRKPS